MSQINKEEKLAIEKYKLLFELWMSENPSKTTKLQMLLATNSILASAFFLANHTIWIAVVGMLFSFVWIVSIGRTVSYQRHWKVQMETLRKKFSDNIIFQTHSTKIKPALYGKVNSRYYLVGTPIVIAFGWLFVILYILIYI